MTRRILLALLAIGCGAAERPARDVVRVGYQRYVSYAPLFIAQAEGFFNRHGLAVELVLLPDGNAGTPLVVAGDIDVLAGPASPGILNAIARGARVRLVADKGSVPDSGCSQMALVGRPGVGLDGTSAAPRSVSPSRATAAIEYFTEMALASAGITLEDLAVHHLPASVHIEAMRRGSVDLIATTEPAVQRLVSSGNHVVRDASEVVPGLTYGFLVFGERLTSAEREVGERFTAAYLEGIRAYEAGKTDRNVAILSAATGDDPDILRRACWPPFRTAGIDTAAFGAFQDWAVRRTLLDRRLGAAAYWDGAFQAAAQRILTRP